KHQPVLITLRNLGEKVLESARNTLLERAQRGYRVVPQTNERERGDGEHSSHNSNLTGDADDRHSNYSPQPRSEARDGSEVGAVRLGNHHAPAQAKAGAKLGDVVFRAVACDPEFFRDLYVRASRCDEPRDLALSRGDRFGTDRGDGINARFGGAHVVE